MSPVNPCGLTPSPTRWPMELGYQGVLAFSVIDDVEAGACGSFVDHQFDGTPLKSGCMQDWRLHGECPHYVD